jgi:hypothetical protein
MTSDQQDLCLALLLVIALDGVTQKEKMQKGVKGFLATLPPEDIARAAGMSVDFSQFILGNNPGFAE